MNITSFLPLLQMIVFGVIKYAVLLYCMYRVIRLAIRKERDSAAAQEDEKAPVSNDKELSD